MGIEIALWRARVGTFSQPIKCRTALPVLRITGVLLGVRVMMFLLLAVNGVETNPGPLAGSYVPGKGKGKGGSTTAAGRGHSNVGETNQRLLRINSSSTQGGAHGGAQGGAHGHGMRSPSPNVSTYSTTASIQPPINQWFSNSGGGMSPGPGSGPGFFGPSRFQSPSYTQSHQSSLQADADISELKQIMLDVQNSVRNMESRFTQVESSLKEVKETSNRLVDSNKKISVEVSSLNKKITKLESDLKASEDKRERLEAQSKRENLRIYGLQEESNETWEDTENKVRKYITRDLEMNGGGLSIERAHRIQGSEKPRPVIVKFSFYKDKERVLKAYRQKRKEVNDLIKQHEREEQNEGEGSDNPVELDFGQFRKEVTVCEDFPNRVMKARNDLRKFLKSAVKEEKNAYLRYDKLVIDGELYEYDSEAGDIVQIDK